MGLLVCVQDKDRFRKTGSPSVGRNPSLYVEKVVNGPVPFLLLGPFVLEIAGTPLIFAPWPLKFLDLSLTEKVGGGLPDMTSLH